MTAIAAVAAPPALVLALAWLRLGPPSPALPRRPRPGPAGVRHTPAWFERLLEPCGLEDPSRIWSAMLWAAPLSLLAVGTIVGPSVAALAAVSAAVTPRALEPVLRRRRLDQRDAQLPGTLERLASALRAGSAPGPAFVVLAAATPPPLGPEMQATAAEIEHGAAMAVAVDQWGGRPDASRAVRLAAAALGLGVDAGGEVARSVDRVAATLREHRELRAEVRSLATQARASAAVLGVAPFGFAALVSSVEPETARFLATTPAGLLCLVTGLGLEALGVLWMARIVASAT